MTAFGGRLVKLGLRKSTANNRVRTIDLAIADDAAAPATLRLAVDNGRNRGKLRKLAAVGRSTDAQTQAN